MTYKVLVSRTFQKQFYKLDAKIRKRIKEAIRQIMHNPFVARAKADIKRIEGTSPPKYRIRIGIYRIIYTVEEKTIKVIEIMKRGKEYTGI